MDSPVVIIPSKNRQNLWCAMASLERGPDPPKIIPVWDVTGGRGPEFCDHILAPQPWGFSKAVNAGIAAAGDRDVIIWNDDAVLIHGEIKYWAAWAYTGGLTFASLIGAPVLNKRPWGQRRGERSGLVCSERKMHPFVAVYIPREVIKTVGLLEERFTGVYGGEDDDYCYRVRQSGGKLWVTDSVHVLHGQALESTFRPGNTSGDATAAKMRFKEIHGFEMGMK